MPTADGQRHDAIEPHVEKRSLPPTAGKFGGEQVAQLALEGDEEAEDEDEEQQGEEEDEEEQEDELAA